MSHPILIAQPGFKVWHISQIYRGPGGPVEAQWVPNVDDCVIDWERGMFRVESLNSNIPTLVAFDPDKFNNENDAVSVTSALSVYQPNIMNRAFLFEDDPDFILTLDALFYVTEPATSFLIYKGTDTTAGSGEIISRNSPEALDPLPFAVMDPGNDGFLRPAVNGITISESLPNGSVVTMVIFDDNNYVMGEIPFVIKKTSAYADPQTVGDNIKIVTDVLLSGVGAYIPGPDPDVLIVPANIGLDNVFANAKATLTFAAHPSETNISITTGGKVRLLGLDGFNPNTLSTENKILLCYYPDADPDNDPVRVKMLDQGQGEGGLVHISHQYTIITDGPDEDAFRIFAIPTYNPLDSFYNLEYYLISKDNLDFVKLSVGDYTISTNTGDTPNLSRLNAVDNPGYNTLIIKVHMQLVFPQRYMDYTFIQTFFLDISGNLIAADDTWNIKYDNDHILVGTYKAITPADSDYQGVYIKSDFGTLEDWLNALYDEIAPLDLYTTQLPTDPNQIQLIYEYDEGLGPQTHTSPRMKVEDVWDQLYRPDELLVNPETIIWKNYSTIRIVWIYAEDPDNTTGGTFYYLGVTPMMIIADPNA